MSHNIADQRVYSRLQSRIFAPDRWIKGLSWCLTKITKDRLQGFAWSTRNGTRDVTSTLADVSDGHAAAAYATKPVSKAVA